MLVPPDNFGLVETGVYRCSKLEGDHFPFLETLQLRSLVLLDAEKPPRLLRSFLEANKVELFNLGGLKISNHHTGTYQKDDDTASVDGLESSAPSEDTLAASIDLVSISTKSRSDQWMLIEKSIICGAFEILLNKTKHPLLVVDLTSTLVGILRKIQKWNLNSIINEYRIYTGNSAKSNYLAQTFLELVQVELVAYEVDQLNQVRKKLEDTRAAKTMSRNRSIDETLLHRLSLRTEGSDDDESIDDDDMDDDLLSASPQIPPNLLKLVEMKKHEKDDDKHTPAGSPGYKSRHNSFTNDILLGTGRLQRDRRRSSIDLKSLWTQNRSFRHANSPSQLWELSIRSSKFLYDRKPRLEDLSPEEVQEIRQKYDFKYYRNLHANAYRYDNVGVLKLRLPSDHHLPEWFIRSRNHWEYNFQRLNVE